MARKAKTVQEKAPENVRTIAISLPENGTAEDIKGELAASVPGWDSLSRQEQIELAQMANSQLRAPKPVKVKLSDKPSGGKAISIAGECEAQGLLKLQKTFAAVTMDPVNARANELLKYMGSVGTDTTDRYNAALSFIESMEPQNQAEVLLLVQMYVTHDAAIRALSQLGTAEWVPHMQTFGNLSTKLLRVSQAQMETLARMRRGGEQVVRHIHVDNRGGQAVIAENVNTGGTQNGKIYNQSDATGVAGGGPAMLGADPFGNGVPIPGRERAETVPHARGHESGSA